MINAVRNDSEDYAVIILLLLLFSTFIWSCSNDSSGSEVDSDTRTNTNTDVDADGDLDYPTAAADGVIDWDADGTTESSVQRNINNLGFSGCNYADATQTLTGHDDWANLLYNFRGTGGYADGAHPEEADDEITSETVQEIREIAEPTFDSFLPLVLRKYAD